MQVIIDFLTPDVWILVHFSVTPSFKSRDTPDVWILVHFSVYPII